MHHSRAVLLFLGDTRAHLFQIAKQVLIFLERVLDRLDVVTDRLRMHCLIGRAVRDVFDGAAQLLAGTEYILTRRAECPRHRAQIGSTLPE